MKVATFSQRLRQLMNMKGLKQIDVARACGIDPSKVCRYVKGNCEAKQDGLFLISETYKIDPAWLMGFDVPIDGKTQQALDGSELALITLFRDMNGEGKEKLMEQAEFLAGKYKKHNKSDLVQEA